MSKNVKKFNFTYDLIPKLFSLPKQLYLIPTRTATSIPEDVLEQTEEQKEYIDATIEQIDKDADRTCYIDFTGLKASQLKAEWLTRNLSEIRISQGVFPTFTQGDNTGACVSEVLHATQVMLPLSKRNTESFTQLMASTKRICFAYRTDSGEPAGFSLIASASGDSDGKHKGWILSTIQNTTAPFKKRKITVLSSSNYVTTKAQEMIAMNSPKSIEAELKAALHNDKIVQLIKRIFNQDGSLNEMEIKRLKSRIKPSINIDDRDRKEAQFNCLLEWSQQSGSTNSHDDSAPPEDVDFFQDGVYQLHLKKKLGTLAATLRQNPNVTKTVSELTLILNNISERIAHFEMLAEKSYRTIELANTYKALAKRIKLEARSLKFDGTRHDENKIIRLSQLDMDQLDKKVKKFYATDPTIQEYYEHKKQSNQKIQEQLAQIPNPANNGFLSRNSFSIGFGSLSGLCTAAALGFIFFEFFPPLTLALILVGTALVIGGILSAVDIYMNEKEHAEQTIHYHDTVSKIRLNHCHELQTAEQSLQKGIDLEAFLESDKPEFLSTLKISKRKPLTSEKVAHALWLNDKDAKTTTTAKNKFALWAAIHEEIGFGIKEVEDVIHKYYEMRS
ncbi:hypothetical protein Lgra_2384 [Legionella gratiana]|uniref:Uncharacterized protein n=1 Tax=Legionella gratiana TaxID=45066 RepID=A0A378JFI7_9GAMM|nr:hypothetical protein [Legionella gratiana]KTD09149.1 hypothetical protein Lgra_2384 [Legionella gratiana]STX45637.1 Uncharacterised protein [Legionella gratiana]